MSMALASCPNTSKCSIHINCILFNHINLTEIRLVCLANISTIARKTVNVKRWSDVQPNEPNK